MYKAKLELNKKVYKGTLTFATIKEIQEVLEADFNKKMTITQIFDALANKDLVVMSTFIFATLKALNEDKELEIVENFELDGEESIEELENKFKKMIDYINDIFKKCMPISKNKSKKKELEFVPLDEEQDEWDYDNLEFLWNGVLKRSNSFLDITPRNFFGQVDAYKKAHKIQDDEIEHI